MDLTNNDVEVVISGIGGYFPKTKNVEELTQKLFDHDEFIDAARWKAGQLEVCDMTGNIEMLNLFDASYFGIHRQQSLFMDPMSRMALQNTFEAIIDAGVNPVEIRGKKIGVFMASSVSENDSLMFENVENGFGVTGQARTMLANRISYWLNAVGPSYSCDSSWLGGIQVLEQGFQMIKSGLCDAVVIGATNLTMNIYPQYLYSQLGLVSPDGKTRPFEDTANGYARCDTNCVLFLQRADLARRCYATVLNAEVHFNGTHYGQLSKLDIDNNRRFLTDFYKNANVDPSTVQYVETNGCAVKHVDSLEISVLDDIFNKDRKEPLLIGSVKSNVGNAEAASMMLSIVKTIIAMENNLIPANLNYDENNVTLKPIKEGRMKVVSENTPWEGDLAAVNGIGLVSSFGHVLLKGNSVKPKEEDDTVKKLQHLYLLSTRTEDGITQLLEKIKSQPELNLEYTKMVNKVFSTHIPGHLYRGYVVKGLEDTAQNEFSHFSGISRPIWFLYSGMGSQWPAMGKTLMNLPICSEVFKRCHKVLEPFDVDLMKILNNGDDPEIFKNILHCFVGIAAIQIALTDVLFALGIKPDNMVGHSVGELGCAYADGCLTAEQMILSSYYRGKASVDAELIPGMMAAIGLGAQQMKPLCPEDIDVACHNGPESSTISGPKESMCNFVADLQAKGTFARLVNVAGIAYHSRYIKPAAPGLLKYLTELIPEPKTRSEKWICSSVPEADGGWNSDLVKTASAEYLTNNLLSSVYFEEACRHIPKEAVVIEIAPHGLLQAILRRSLDSSCVNVALTKRGAENSTTFLMQAIGKLYLAGVSLDTCALYEPVGQIKEEKKKYQIVPRGTPCLANLVTWAHTETWRTGLDEFKDYSNSEQNYQLDRTSEQFRDLQGYRILGIMDDDVSSIIIPVAAYLPLVCKILSNTKRVENAVFENIQLVRHRVLPAASKVYIPLIRVMVQRGTGQFEVSDRYGVVAKGMISVPENNKEITELSSSSENFNIGKKIIHVDGEEFYKELSSRGHVIQWNLKSVKEVDIFQNGMKAQIQWKSGWYSFVISMLQLCIYRTGEFEKQALDISFIRNLSVTFLEPFIPTNDSIIPVIVDYSTGIISSPFLNIQGPVCTPIKLNTSSIITDNFYTNYDFSTITLSPTELVKIGAVAIKESSLNINDLQTSSVEWFEQLNKLLDSGNCDFVYIISRVLPPNGINYFLNYLRSLKNGNCIKLVFLLDPKAPEFIAIEDEFYEFVFTDVDNSVFIYKTGKWNKVYNTSLELSQMIEKHEEANCLTESYLKRHIPKIDIRYMGINSSNLVSTEANQNDDKKMGVLDYSGIEISTNKRIMGLASQGKANRLITDPILRWELPDDWSFVDGAASMYAYAMAYHALFEVISIQPGESILIHNGCSNMGQALIRVANSQGCMIYTTVANEKQKAILMAHMKMLNDYQILDYTTVHFERKLMSITQGQGVRVVMNCLTGELLRATSRCVSTLGRFLIFQDEETDVDYTETIGLGLFFKCKGMYGCSLSGICNFSIEAKNKIHEHIVNGLKTKVIVPVRRSIFRGSEKKLGNILRYVTGPYVTGSAIISVKDNGELKSSKNEENVNKKIQNKPKDGNIIVYGGNEAEMTTTTLRWLSIKYPTNKVILISPLCAQKHTVEHNYLNRFITNLRKYKPEFTLELLEAPANDATSRNVVQKLVTLTPKIQTVINLTTENNSTLLSLAKKLPSLRFIFLSSTGSSNRYSDTYAPYKNASFISWDKKRPFSQVIHCLEHAIENEVEIVVRKANLDEDEENQNSLSFRDFFSVLPSTIPSVSTWNPPTATVQISSLNTASSCEKNDSPPLFVVPGLFGGQCRYLRSLLRRLLSPAYVLDSSYENISYDELAEKMAKRICEISPNGPYNLIGVSTGGALALEIAKYLEIATQTSLQVYLLDGIPETVQHILNEAKSSSNIKNMSKQAEIDHFYKLMAADVDMTHPRAKKASDGLQKRINAILNYKPNVKPPTSVIRIVRPQDSSKDCSGDLLEICKQTRIEIIKGNHFTMLQTNNIAEYINENILTIGHHL